VFDDVETDIKMVNTVKDKEDRDIFKQQLWDNGELVLCGQSLTSYSTHKHVILETSLSLHSLSLLLTTKLKTNRKNTQKHKNYIKT